MTELHLVDSARRVAGRNVGAKSEEGGSVERKKESRERTTRRSETERARERREPRITVVVNDERGVPVVVIAGKLRYYEPLAKNVTSR